MDSTSYRTDGFGRATWTISVPVFKIRDIINSKKEYHKHRVTYWMGRYADIEEEPGSREPDDTYDYTQQRKNTCNRKIEAHEKQIRECDDWLAMISLDSEGKTEFAVTLDDAQHFGIRRFLDKE